MENSCTINIIFDNKIENNLNLINIQDLSFINLKISSTANFFIDLFYITKKNINYFIKKIYNIKYKTILTKNSTSNLNFYINNYDYKNKVHTNFIYSLNAIFKKDKKERYSYIYDIVCESLDKCFAEHNLCDFKNDKCAEKRHTAVNVGCCRHYKNKILGPLLKHNFVQCEYLINKKCSIKCISCKLFTCDYLKKQGIQFKIKDIFLLDTFFNPIQKYIIKTSVFTPKEHIIKRLLFFSL